MHNMYIVITDDSFYKTTEITPIMFEQYDNGDLFFIDIGSCIAPKCLIDGNWIEIEDYPEESK